MISEIEKLNIERKVKKKSKIPELCMTVEELEAEHPPVKSRLEAQHILTKHGVNAVGKSGGDTMLYAAQFGLINIIKFIVNFYNFISFLIKFIEAESPQFQLNYTNSFGEGLLHYAAKGNQPKMVSYLLQKNIDPNTQNKFHETAIFIAAEMGSEQVLHILLTDKRCKADAQDKFGDTALHFACRDGQFEICNYLLKKSRRLVRIKNQEGKTPLTYAMDNGQTAVVQLLREHDAEATREDRTKSVQELAKKLMAEPPDYKKSIFKHQASKIEVFGKKQNRAQIRAEKAVAEEQAEIRKKLAALEKERQIRRAKEAEERAKKEEEMAQAKKLLEGTEQDENGNQQLAQQ